MIAMIALLSLLVGGVAMAAAPAASPRVDTTASSHCDEAMAHQKKGDATHGPSRADCVTSCAAIPPQTPVAPHHTASIWSAPASGVQPPLPKIILPLQTPPPRAL